MRKYLNMMAIEWKNSVAYRADTWLSALFSMGGVLLAYLLWKAVFRGAAQVGGMSLAEMTTYYLIVQAIQPLTQGDGALKEFSQEIRTGRYAKHIVRPVSPFATFMTSSISKALFPLLSNALVMAAAALLFRPYFVLPTLENLAVGTAVVLLGGVLNMLFNYIVACSTFKFTDGSGVFIVKNLCNTMLSGAMIPLNVMFGGFSGWAVYSPFAYMAYYPATLLLGKAQTPAPLALAVLCGWIAIGFVVCKCLERTAPAMFEGVGL